ncbi:flavin-containing monooxygenase [Pseudonocardia cypriaca]|uniref:Cation diffusion facilitator CzcD-associated flavoprotein CzcO n=1 Tax=Pseudonocardia cypriaca TaxID=882449 RepID=A0A543FW60_9PSEU|nr:NAD(P)/FAD-dependent oxidoreductase [Pseudonocardia cypriaca]TQM38051.1 cation diffusion facilitator CzcD-associated flavoprotein CzcO [Pseudonocardia cypriaca]
MEHLDVLVVGAGISGIDAAYRLQTEHPQRTYAILEARDAIGGTWDLFRFPGIRSDSDMFTLGFPFRPWRAAAAIADGASIRRYLQETAAEFGIDRRIRFGRRVTAAAWSSPDQRWIVEVQVADGSTERYSCDFLFLGTGYYRYDRGYLPDLPVIDAYRGTVVHPQHWPEDLDCAGKRVVVIGSGATAVTLVPALAERGAQVTMLQRSPSYVVALPGTDRLVDRLPRWAHRLIRWKNVLVTSGFYELARRAPGAAKRLLRAGLERQIPDHRVIDRDFTPRYQPWDQRLCVVPDGDMFRAMRSGRAEVVTDTIATFTSVGIRLDSGRELPADVVVTATGLQLQVAGGMRITVDGTVVDPGRTVVYRGCLLSGVPNLAICIGYVNASWTLRSDLTARYVCRLLAHMDAHGYRSATPEFDGDVAARPLLALTSGYVQRAADVLPKQGTAAPWVLHQNYLVDVLSTRFGDVTRDMVFAVRPMRRSTVAVDAAAPRPD